MNELPESGKRDSPFEHLVSITHRLILFRPKLSSNGLEQILVSSSC